MEMIIVKGVRRPKSCPSVRWRSPVSESSSSTTSKLRIEGRGSKFGVERCSRRGDILHLPNNAMFLFLLFWWTAASFTSFVYCSSPLSSSSPNYLDNKLAVLTEPKLASDKNLPQVLTKPVAQTVRLDCDVSGSPEPLVKWLKDDQEIEIGGRISIRKVNSLVISQTVTSDSGNYSCVASNSVANKTFQIANLVILASEERPAKPRGLELVGLSSDSVSLTWRTAPKSNLPVISYSVHWTPVEPEPGEKEEQKLSLNNSIVVDRLRPSTNYTIYVRAYNSKGASDRSKLLHIVTKPLESVVETSSAAPSPVPTEVTKIRVSGPSLDQLPVRVPVTINELKPLSPTILEVTWNALPTLSPVSPSTRDYLIQTSFEVHYRRPSQTSYQVHEVSDSNATAAVIEALQPGVKYDVRAVCVISSPDSPTIPNQRPSLSSSSSNLGTWISIEMPSRDSHLPKPPLLLPPSSAPEVNVHSAGNQTRTLFGTENSSSNIFTHKSNHSETATHNVPDSSFKAVNVTPFSIANSTEFNLDDSDEKILGEAWKKLLLWSFVATGLLLCLTIFCCIIVCCRKRSPTACAEGSEVGSRTFVNGYPSMYGDMNGEAREMELFIDRGDQGVGVHLDTKGGSPESFVTTKLNGHAKPAKRNIKTNGSLTNYRSRAKSGSGSEEKRASGDQWPVQDAECD